MSRDAYPLFTRRTDFDTKLSPAFKIVAARVVACAARGYERPWISQDLNELQPLTL